MEDETTDIEKILAERVKLDAVLQTQFSKKVTVMFTDIKGSTSFYESMGNIDGRLMVYRHNEIVVPIIKDGNGVLLKTIGDATMSLFDDPFSAVKAAMQIQLNLKSYNSGKSQKDQIHVRIGLNYGSGIVEHADVYGDVVNVASRVEAMANAGDIFLTGELYREVKNSDEFIFRFVDRAAVKGKKELVEVYRLLWHEEDLFMGKTRHADETQHQYVKEGLFVIEASLTGNILKMSGFERTEGEERAVKNYREIKFNESRIRDYTGGIIDLLNRANRRGKIGNEMLVKLKEYGRLLYDGLIPSEIKDRLSKTDQKNLMISIDDSLVHIPWELVYDGKDFLCQRFSMGRSVSTKQPVSAVARAVSRPLKMIILADPQGDLKAAYDEGVGIKTEIEKLDEWINVSLKTTDIKADSVRAKIRSFDIIHYAGHAVHNDKAPGESGWMFKDDKMSAEDIIAMTGVMPMPSLVFSNACQTGRTEEWKIGEDYEYKIFGLANAFLLSGVQHYIGTFWEIPDEAGYHFAIYFYKKLCEGVSIGEALRLARQSLIKKYGEDTIVWAGYMLYGDPTTKYIYPYFEGKKTDTEMDIARKALSASGFRHQEEVIPFPNKSKLSSTSVLLGVAMLLLVAISLFLINTHRSDKTASVSPEKIMTAKEAEENSKRIDELVAALSAKYREGKFEQARVKEDEWSSKPVTLVAMDIKSGGNDGNKDGEKMAALLSQILGASNRVSVVEREILAKLLEELKLSSSSLADPATALKIGKVLSANIIITGSIIPENKGQVVMLRCIDTETTAIRKVISIDITSGTVNRDSANKLATQIIEWVKSDFPVRGKIVSVSGGQCRINIGQTQGLKKGDLLEVVVETGKGSGIYTAVGQIEISQPGKDSSVALLQGKVGGIKEGMKVRGLQ
ncbi:MAG: CHAT domain-containing protein [Nitrospirae bacterium]|nr:CHAT domain-containing protein [Nitrospirota bacterium]